MCVAKNVLDDVRVLEVGEVILSMRSSSRVSYIHNKNFSKNF